jgi:argininosuccinate lyase
MMDGMVARFAKDQSLTDDQAKRLRDVFRRSGAEFRDAWAPLNAIPSDATETDRDRVRHEVAAKSAEIEQRKDDEIRNVLSQTQFEAYKKQFAMPKKGFGTGAKDGGGN